MEKPALSPASWLGCTPKRATDGQPVRLQHSIHKPWSRGQRSAEADGRRMTGVALPTAALLASFTAWQSRPRTQRQVKKRPYRPYVKKKRATQELKSLFKSGYWQETIEEFDDHDVFDFINQELLWTADPAELKFVGKVAEFAEMGSRFDDYNPPEYRSLPMGSALQKGIVQPHPLDEADDRSLGGTLSQAISPQAIDGVDIVISLKALELLLLYVDRRLSENMQARGANTRRGVQGEMLELVRLGRLPEPADSSIVTIGATFHWQPSAHSYSDAASIKKTYDYALYQLGTGRSLSTAAPTQRVVNNGWRDQQVLLFDLDDIRLMVKVPVAATVPAQDADDLEGEAVQMMTANHRNASALWGRHLPSRYTMMLLGNVGLISRAVLEQGILTDLQELSREDLLLDRPELEEQAGELLGQLAAVLKLIQASANCEGGKGRDLSVYYCDKELQIAASQRDADDEDDQFADLLS
mmetsp:Transcript_35949/g.84188  ORF Transcript_35949/g.84188 Transcript_35949/m.84188 type:complete len:470 (+) Transcript_35949:62-1471(+)